jgi:poly(3-hydroxybutyrate) depolymerase
MSAGAPSSTPQAVNVRVGAPGAFRRAAVGVFCAAAAAALVQAVPAAGPVAAPPPAARGELPEPDPLLRDLIGFRVRYRDLLRRHAELVRSLRVGYTAWDGSRRTALLILPRRYGPQSHLPIPLVISPHGRGIKEADNARFWGGLPAFGPFAVVNPEGQGRRLTLYSWGWRGQIDDLARMPEILERALPWLRVDRKRVYAVGSSMGGQETLLLAALHPRLLTGAAALDSATDMAARYYAFPQLRGGLRLQRLAAYEIGGTPRTAAAAYADRSPIHYARRLAFSGVPLHIWWSLRDRIVRNQDRESGRLYRTIVRLDPGAPVTRYVGTWAHSKEMHATARLPLALVKLKLIKLDEPLPAGAKP